MSSQCSAHHSIIGMASHSRKGAFSGFFITNDSGLVDNLIVLTIDMA